MALHVVAGPGPPAHSALGRRRTALEADTQFGPGQLARAERVVYVRSLQEQAIDQ
jgi:hypothetical protein